MSDFALAPVDPSALRPLYCFPGKFEYPSLNFWRILHSVHLSPSRHAVGWADTVVGCRCPGPTRGAQISRPAPV